MRYPLRYVIPVMLLVIGLLAAAAVALTSIRMSHDNTEQFVTEFLTTIGNQAASDVAAGLRRDNDARIRNAIEQLQVLRGLELALLIDDNDTVTQATRREFAGRFIDRQSEPNIAAIVDSTRDSGEQRHFITNNRFYYANYISNTLPLLLGGVASGSVLVIVYDMSAAEAGQGVSAINQAIIVGVTALAISFLCWIFLSNALIGRMAKLVEAARRIGAGQLRTPIHIEGRDEIATLGQALDAMRIDLSEKQSQLVMAAEDLALANATVERERAMLAQRIEERTHDLTVANSELARAKEAAEDASRAKSAFLATVSHEIRTPMNGVLGAMELLDRSGLDERRASLLGTAQESARSLLVLLNDLLDMAKIEAGRIELISAPASLQTIIDHVLATHTPTAAAKGTSVSGSVSSDAPEWVSIDAMRVQQVLGNMVSNAVKFTDRGNVDLRVDVDCQDHPRCNVRFTVSDNGCGIPAETLAKLFRPFQQGAVEVARKTGGTGLGLAICRGLAERMGGTVSLTSEPGKGTTACFEIPATIARPPRQKRSNQSALDESVIIELLNSKSSRSKVGVHILVVDDHPTNRLLQIRQLEQLGAVADTANDGLEALEKLRQKHFDIVITDCEMPNMDGFALATAIRSSGESFCDIPLIACTAHALPDIGERCVEHGMNSVLTKPMRLDELANALSDYWPSESSLPIPPEKPAVEAAEILDEEALDLLTGGDSELRETMLDAFMKDLQQTLPNLEKAIRSSDYSECKQIAHRNKGACAIFGAVALGEAFAELEHWSGLQIPAHNQVARAMESIRHESERLRSQVSSFSRKTNIA